MIAVTAFILGGNAVLIKDSKLNAFLVFLSLQFFVVVCG
jgi:hypothetical protein